MKKNLFAFLMMTLVLSASSGICFANENDGSQAYAGEQALIAEMSEPVVNDQEYPQWGLRTHSWITGTGRETIAHTQLIDMTSGTVVKNLEKRCSYTDPTYND